jgi:hypothetical protein
LTKDFSFCRFGIKETKKLEAIFFTKHVSWFLAIIEMRPQLNLTIERENKMALKIHKKQ